MKRPHLLAVSGGPGDFERLWTALREAGMRVGWLEWSLDSPSPQEGPLAAATQAGAARAVEIHADGAVTRKPRRGPPILDDILREQFLGCAVVFVRGSISRRPGSPSVARLEVSGDEWRIVSGAESRRLATAALVARLRSPKIL
jgi:hypothetical protein